MPEGSSTPETERTPTRALEWVSVDTLATSTTTATTTDAAPAPLITTWPRRAWWRRLVGPAVTAAVALVAYVVAMLLWPLGAITPQIEAVTVPTSTAPASQPAWPKSGEAAVAVAGAGTLSSGTEPVRIASIAKLVTVLVALDKAPLQPGEQGPSYTMTATDRADWLAQRANGESTYPITVGDEVTQLQLVEGMLVGSISNYATKLSREVFGNEAAYLAAARSWLDGHGLGAITVTDASGIGTGNRGTPEAVIALAQLAMANPVVAEAVALPSVELPTAGLVENTNELLGEDGIDGIKTGTVGSLFNLVSSRPLDVGGTQVRLYAAVLGQPSDAARWSSTRELLASVAGELTPTLAAPAGTVVGTVTTAWGATSSVVTTADAQVIVWNGVSSRSTVDMALPAERTAGAEVGSLTVSGGLDEATVPVALTDAVPNPSALWRLTHPIELLGLGSLVG